MYPVEVIKFSQQDFTKLGYTDRFAVRFTGALNIEEKNLYFFRLWSDDGSRLFIDGKKIVDNDGLHGRRAKEGSLELDKGPHSLLVEFFENGGGDNIELE